VRRLRCYVLATAPANEQLNRHGNSSNPIESQIVSQIVNVQIVNVQNLSDDHDGDGC
jgi:type IV secretory pathway TrbF-like protein